MATTTITLPPPSPLAIPQTPPPSPSPEFTVRPRVLDIVDLLSSMPLGEKEAALLRSLTEYLK